MRNSYLKWNFVVFTLEYIPTNSFDIVIHFIVLKTNVYIHLIVVEYKL